MNFGSKIHFDYLDMKHVVYVINCATWNESKIYILYQIVSRLNLGLKLHNIFILNPSNRLGVNLGFKNYFGYLDI